MTAIMALGPTELVSIVTPWGTFNSWLVIIVVRYGRAIDNNFIQIHPVLTWPVAFFHFTNSYRAARYSVNIPVRWTAVIMIAIVYIIVVNIVRVVHNVDVAISGSGVAIP
jgi:hypothetical protein